MKYVFFLGLLLSAVNCISQCNYYYLQNNKTITMGMYNRKGADDGKYVYKVSGLTKSGGVASANVESEVYDKKGKLIGGGKGSMQCKNGQLLMDMKMMLNPQQMQQFKDAKVEGSGEHLEYPSSLKVGQTLKDATFEMTMKSESGLNGSVDMEVTNRKVEAKESVTTPAGTWDAYKITNTTKMTISIGIAIPMSMQMTEWFVPDFGVIKTESKWGKTELISIN